MNDVYRERPRTNWNVEYENVDPIRIRDPVAEALAVLEPDEPFVIISYVTGAAEEDGFGGLAGGYGDRKRLLHFGDADGTDPTFTFERTDADEAVRVVYHVEKVPNAGPAAQYLERLIDGTATAEERAAFAEAWHGRVRTVLADDDLFAVSRWGDWRPGPSRSGRTLDGRTRCFRDDPEGDR